MLMSSPNAMHHVAHQGAAHIWIRVQIRSRIRIQKRIGEWMELLEQSCWIHISINPSGLAVGRSRSKIINSFASINNSIGIDWSISALDCANGWMERDRELFVITDHQWKPTPVTRSNCFSWIQGASIDKANVEQGRKWLMELLFVCKI